MPPLPGPDDPLLRDLPEIPKYNYVNYLLPAENDAVNLADKRIQMHIRILGGLLIHAPTVAARNYVAEQISSVVLSPDVLDRLSKLGELYFDHFIRVCEYPFLLIALSIRPCALS